MRNDFASAVQSHRGAEPWVMVVGAVSEDKTPRAGRIGVVEKV